MPCGQANPSVTFSVKGTGTFFWSSCKGDFIISEDSKSATLKPSENPGSGVAGVAYDKHAYCSNCGSQLQYTCNDVESPGGPQHAGPFDLSVSCLNGSAPGACTGGPPGGNCSFGSGIKIACNNIWDDAAYARQATPHDLRTASMIALGCRPCGLQFNAGKPAVIRVTDKKGNAVQGTVT